jgi:SAM-dependent methyltransferase
MYRLAHFIYSIKFLRRPLMRLVCAIDTINYKIFSTLAIVMNDGVHPKYDIIKYNDFYISQVGKEENVMDVGSGTGTTAFAVAPYVKKIVGVEIDEPKMLKSRERYQHPNLKFVCGDVTKDFDLMHEEMPNVDKIMLSNVLEHIEDRVTFLKHLSKVSDTIILRVPMISRDWNSVYKKQLGFEYRLDPTHFIEFTLESLTEEVTLAGWHIESHSVQFGEFWGVIKHNA